MVYGTKIVYNETKVILCEKVSNLIKDRVKEEKVKLMKKLKKKKQTILFGIEPNYNKVTQKKMKKIGKNQWKEVAIVRVEESCSVENTNGLFQHMGDCMRQSWTSQGLGAHKLSWFVVIAKRERDEDNEENKGNP